MNTDNKVFLVMNILSFKPGTKFLGCEIKKWAEYQVKNNTSHKKIANYIIKHYNKIKDDSYYIINLFYPSTACGKRVKNKILILLDKKNKNA